MSILVAGATGNVGSATVRKLNELGAHVKALTRTSSSDKAAPLKELPNTEIIECDLMDKANLASAFSNVKAAFLACSNCKEQVELENNFIDCAVAAGCQYLVKLGTVAQYTSKDSPVEYARYHASIEEHLAEAAGEMKWTVLQPNWFMSNHLGDIFGTLPTNVIVYPVSPEAKAAIVDPRDVGDLAAQLLLADPADYHGHKFDVCGPEAVECSCQDWATAAMKAGFPEWMAEAIVAEGGNFTLWAAGKFDFPSSPEVLALAAPKRCMSEWIKEWAPRSPPAQ